MDASKKEQKKAGNESLPKIHRYNRLANLHIFDDECDLFGDNIIAFTIEGTDLPSFRPATEEEPCADRIAGIVVEDNGDVTTDILTFAGLSPPLLEIRGHDVTFLKGDITEFCTAWTFTECQIVAILEFDDFEFGIDSIDTLEVTSGYTSDIDFKIVSTNMIEICTTARHIILLLNLHPRHNHWTNGC